MTSPCELHIYCNDEVKSRNIAKKILTMAKELEHKYNFYNPNSYLSALNQRKTNRLDIQTKDLLTRDKLFYTKTNGIFDITMGTLTKARKLSTIEKIEEETQRLSLLKLTNPTQIVYMINLFLRICYEKNYYY